MSARSYCDITVDDIPALERNINEMIAWCIGTGDPLALIDAAANPTPRSLIAMASYGTFTTYAIRMSFDIPSEDITRYRNGIAQRLLDGGCLVNQYRRKHVAYDLEEVGATHLIGIANSGSFVHTYKFKGDEHDAFLATVKFGGRLTLL